MKKDIFKKIIIESQAAAFNLIPRELILPPDMNEVITLYGPRRCGKTYLFYQTIRRLREEINPSKIIYINFEDERLFPFEKNDWEDLLDSYFELYPESVNSKVYLFLDEIQGAPLWEKFIRRLSEKKSYGIFLTGSSSKLLAREITTSLRGRTINFLLLPFSFKEFLKYQKFETGKNIEYSNLRHKIKNLFEEYLKFGGFPEIFDKEEMLKTQILQSYFDLIFYKDIVERHKIRNFGLMKNLMHYLISHFSSLFSITNYYNFLKSQGQKIGKDTLFEYIYYLEEVNFVKFVPVFDYSLKKQLINPKKIYSIDTGLANAASYQFSENKGRCLENLAFLELLRRKKEIFYFKDDQGNEVDFLLTEKGRPKELIQITSDLSDAAVKEREIAPLLNAANKFGINEGLILTGDQKAEFKEGKIKIKVLPLWLWLYGKPRHQP